jgi:Spy/CpxP family protein refolding chaperone
MLAQLNLTDDQRGQIRQILQNGQGQNRKVTMRQIRAVLTPEQRQQWRALRQQQRALRRGQGAPQPNPQPQAPGQNT